MATSRGRDLAKEAAWRRRLDRQGASGQSVRAWCRRHRVKETSFHWWRRELARRDRERAPSARRNADTPAASFVPVQVTEEPVQGSDHQIEIVLPDGRRVRVTDTVNREMLAVVLDVLERRAC